MPSTLIAAHLRKDKALNKEMSNKESFLSVAEFFSDTIQGEGFSIGHPATFLRLKGCTLNCCWCDTASVWKDGDAYSFEELFVLLEQYQVIQKLQKGQHFIITGGSPLKQQKALIHFFRAFQVRYAFLPFIEIENEVVIEIQTELLPFVQQWNHSPKLSSSHMRQQVRYFPKLIQQASLLPNSWFKFVIDIEEDWNEILKDFLEPMLLQRSQIILMPMADNKIDLEKKRQEVAELAVREQVLFSDRLHITIYDKKTGV